MKLRLQIVFFLATVAAVALLADAWRTARRDSAHLAATLAAQNSILQQAGEQQKRRDSQLASALAGIQAAKRAVHTPEQAAQKLPEAFPDLPLPIAIHIAALSTKPADSSGQTSGFPEKPTRSINDHSSVEAQETSVSIPRPDLIPLYNDMQDCRAAQLRATALTTDLSDEKARSSALLRERDAAITAARGGSILQRLKRSAKWFLIGAAAGATLAAAARH